MIVYFADRQLNIIGQASTELPEGLIVTADRKTEDIETGVAVFECRLPFDKATRALVEKCTEVGNYILRSHDNENEFYTIIDAEIDTKKREVYIYAEDDGMDLLNEVVGIYEADQAYPISHYINKYAAGAGFEIGINEAEGLTRKLSWDGESTATERIASIATQFDGCEVSYSFEVDGLTVTRKFINIYRERGKDIGVTLRLNQDIDSIVTTKSIANLATALQCVGGTPEDENYEDEIEPTAITLEGYSYDDGDFYVDGVLLKSREALKKWSRYLWKNDDTQKIGGHIVKQYSYDTISQQELCSRAITALKKIRDMEVNYEVDITKFPDNVKIGDRINIVDDAGELYVSARVLQLETSVADQEYKATLGEYLIKSSGISQKVAELAAQFAKSAHSATRALELAKNARDAAESAQSQVDEAVKSVEEAQKAVDEVADVVEEAKQSAANAQQAASNAQSIVDSVEERVGGMEQTVANAKAAAENAYAAAETAQAKAEEAAGAAANAQTEAETAKTNAQAAVTAANSAFTNAGLAITNANEAKGAAKNAQDTAAAAKADAEQAEKDLENLGERLTTVTNTMSADYARKTDLTETKASLQSQISQNAGTISMSVSMLSVIDETANDAQDQAEKARKRAEAAQEQAEQAAALARTAQQQADAANQAAANAQAEADTAMAAADTAQAVADAAEAALAAAKADLDTILSRADATEEEIAEAQWAVAQAQAEANTAKADASAAAYVAAKAKEIADAAVITATEAQATANTADSYAKIAQSVASEAANASAAQDTADGAARLASSVKEIADQAVADAATAQAAADKADADAKQAVIDSENADKAAAQAASDLVAAKKRLADVLANVDSTEAEVNAAQAAVDTAQAAADVAMANATQAAAHAAQAEIDATNAQIAADKAQAEAEAAQKAADEAQKAADEANKAVGELDIRLIDAEAWIDTTADQIGLFAKKTEVTAQLNGYYTKTEADSKFTVTPESITSVVSKTFASKDMVEGIEIGGRNMLVGASSGEGWHSHNSFDEQSREFTRTTTGTSEVFIYCANTFDLEAGKEYTLSFQAKQNGYVSSAEFFVLPKTFSTTGIAYNKSFAVTTAYKEYKFTFVPNNAATNLENCELRFDNNGTTTNGTEATLYIKDVKLEKGNRATAWTPALEDVADDIDYARSCGEDAQGLVKKAESKIQQLADAIEMLVTDENGVSLMTQTSTGWSFNIGDITSKLNETAQNVGGLSENVKQAQNDIDGINQAVGDFGKIAERVEITTYDGQPCVELSEGDSDFKLRITNTELQFVDGSTIPAYVSNEKLMIEQAEVKDELQFGGFIWKSRDNGNIGLMWKGVNS